MLIFPSELAPCPFCDKPVEFRHNIMIGEWFITHIDWNSSCPMRPFYGSKHAWNTRPGNERLRDALSAAYAEMRCESVAQNISSATFDQVRTALDAAGGE